MGGVERQMEMESKEGENEKWMSSLPTHGVVEFKLLQMDVVL